MQINDVRNGLRVHMINGYTGKRRGVPATMTGEIRKDFHPDCDGGSYWVFAEVVFDPCIEFPECERRFVMLRALEPLDEAS